MKAHLLLRSVRRLRELLTASTVTEFGEVIYTTKPDPSEHMTDAERRYHLGHQHGR